MTLGRIDILNFKNIEEASLEFSSGANCLVGSNGMGKSNLLEAIWYLAMGRSPRGLTDAELVRYGEKQMMLRGLFSKADDAEGEIASSLEVGIGWSEGKRKQLRRDGKECRRLSDHIGTIPIVLAQPSDLQLVTGGAEERRRLMDNVISQADASYLQHLIRYNEALKQRNSMLRNGVTDRILLEAVENQMETSGNAVVETRLRWCADMAAPFARYYSLIAPDGETAGLDYKPSTDGMTFKEAIARARVRDAALGYTTAGPHRDDLALTLSGHDVRRAGSQGQMKSFTVALRLAVFEYLGVRATSTPILLLDDIFDKLDASRVERIVATVTSPGQAFGQIFITDTNRKHIDSILSQTAGDYRLFGVSDGRFSILPTA